MVERIFPLPCHPERKKSAKISEVEGSACGKENLWSLNKKCSEISIRIVSIYFYRTAPTQADSSTSNPSGFPLGMTVVGIVSVYRL
ncbi:hypothetical protein ABID14_001674 [Peptoniphilus olsenii]|uniref:Uncharacterized protein n=1 Tax=Peptoniphilus olsenii TaxID=411570 RepID=A0ABV2JE43_9FIRM